MKRLICFVLSVLVFCAGMRDGINGETTGGHDNQADISTENDLREVMGLERIEGTAYRDAALIILEECSSRLEFNSLVDELSQADRQHLSVLSEQTREKNRCFRELRTLFLGNREADELLGTFAEYDSLCQAVGIREPGINTGMILEKFDSGDIARRKAYAQSVLKLCTTKEDIGNVGMRAETFLRNNLHLAKVDADGIVCHVTPQEEICSQFRGTVLTVTDHVIVVSSGETIIMTYTGVRAADGIMPGISVEQYQLLGEASGETVRVDLTMCGQAESLLCMYGDRARYWYMEYAGGNPWDADGELEAALEKIRDYPGEGESAQESASGSTMTDGDGNEVELTSDYNPYRGDTGELEDNPFYNGINSVGSRE